MLKKDLKKLRGDLLEQALGKLEELDRRNNEIYSKLNELENKIDAVINRLSLSEDIITTKAVDFLVPNAPRDDRQEQLLQLQTAPDQYMLEDLDKYLGMDSTILDIGAAIGTHSIYWAKTTKAKKIYAFEPVYYRILETNIEINNLQDRVKIFKFGLGDKSSQAKIKFLKHNVISSASLEENTDWAGISIYALDDIDEIKKEEKIDFVKIDVEGMEKYVLKGGKQTLSKHSPVVFYVASAGEYQYTYNFLKKLGYEEPIVLSTDNYLFIHKRV